MGSNKSFGLRGRPYSNLQLSWAGSYKNAYSSNDTSYARYLFLYGLLITSESYFCLRVSCAT